MCQEVGELSIALLHYTHSHELENSCCVPLKTPCTLSWLKFTLTGKALWTPGFILGGAAHVSSKLGY
jgi:hypothetical protein